MPPYETEYPLDYRYITTNPVYTTDCAGASWTINPKFFTSNDIDELARKIYKVFSEHIQIDISEDEFMELLEKEI